MSRFTESVVEDAALAWLESLGYAVKHGPEIVSADLLFLAAKASLVVIDGYHLSLSS